jgi:hypothetical protein
VTIKTDSAPSISQRALNTYLLMERAAGETRRVLIRSIQAGALIEPGALAINAVALIEPLPPLVVPAHAAQALGQISRELRTLRVEAPA